MFKSILAVIASGVLALSCTGCTSFETNRTGSPVEVKMQAEVKPEIEAGKHMVDGRAKVNCLFGIFTWGAESQAVGINYGGSSGSGFFTSPADVARNGAAFQACSDAKADLLLAPRYNLTIKDYIVFKTIDCEVKGFPGKLKSVKVINK